MTFHNLGDVQQSLNDILVHRAPLKVKPYVCAGAVAKTFRINVEAATCNDAIFYEVLYSLMDGSP